jgi:hypothetical protein
VGGDEKMCKSSTIKKPYSYILGILKNEDDILPYDDLIKRLAENDEFQVDIKNINNEYCQGTINYKSKQYQVEFYEDDFQYDKTFRIVHPINEEDFQKIKDSKKCIVTGIIFTENNIDSFHFQLKLISTLIPKLLGIYDNSAILFHAGKWVKMAAKSLIQPNPDYMYTIHIVNDEKANDSSVWIHTHGLNRCGSVEIEILNSDMENYEYHETVIQIISNNIITKHFLPESEDGFYIGSNIVGTWIPLDEALKEFPSDIPGNQKDRKDELHQNSAVIYIYLSEPNFHSQKYSHISEINDELKENPVFYISSEETARMRGLAIERWEYVVSSFDEQKHNKILMKFGLLVDKEYNIKNENSLEHLWFEVVELDKNKIVGILLNSPYYISRMHENDKISLDKSLVTDWVIYTPFGEITPDNIYLLEDRKKFHN